MEGLFSRTEGGISIYYLTFVGIVGGEEGGRTRWKALLTRNFGLFPCYLPHSRRNQLILLKSSGIAFEVNCVSDKMCKKSKQSTSPNIQGLKKFPSLQTEMSI